MRIDLASMDSGHDAFHGVAGTWWDRIVLGDDNVWLDDDRCERSVCFTKACSTLGWIR